MFQRVIVPLDGSELAERALDYGVAMAERFDARLSLLRAFNEPEKEARMMATMSAEPGGVLDPRTVDLIAEAVKDEQAEARAYLDAQVQRLSGRALRIEALLPQLGPAEAILQEAQREPDTVVVMSSHGRGGLGRLVFGSVAQKVLQDCRAPVLLLRPGEAVTTMTGHDTAADVSIGADVVGADGSRLGEVHRVVVDARLNRVTAIVVKHGTVFGQERELPMSEVNRIENGVVYADLDSAAFEALDRFVEERYRVPDPDHAGPRGLERTQYLLDATVAEGPLGGLGGAPHSPPPPRYTQTGPDDIQTSALRAGLPVTDAAGERLGEIGELSVAPDTGALTHITLRRGMLFKSDTEIPVAWVQDVSDDGVVLRVGKDEVERLG